MIDLLEKNDEFCQTSNKAIMSLIKSISGIRGTIGGFPGQGLTPVDIVSFTAAYGQWLAEEAAPLSGYKYRVVVGRDARISGPMVVSLVCNTLRLFGIDIIELGLATTPTVEMAVIKMGFDGGIILSASHNPGNWNALKLLNSRGEFLSDKDGIKLLARAESGQFCFAEIGQIGTSSVQDFLGPHIDSILELPLVKVPEIRAAGFKVVVDAVNSVGGIAVPALLEALGVKEIVCLNCDPNGEFAHNPEPIPENLKQLSQIVKDSGADLGIAVDPDVDRLAFVCEDGQMFGEEYTLVAAADYVLSHRSGNTVSNLSSSRALRDITLNYGGQYFAAAVGEVNVVEKMKATTAIIGGEGNGGVIYPELHYGRDAMAGVALILSHLAIKGIKMSELREQYPDYYISKNKIQLTSESQPDDILDSLAKIYVNFNPDLSDGVKIDFPDSWVHLRKSNTEPILRIYAEAGSIIESKELAKKMISEILQLMQLTKNKSV